MYTPVCPPDYAVCQRQMGSSTSHYPTHPLVSYPRFLDLTNIIAMHGALSDSWPKLFRNESVLLDGPAECNQLLATCSALNQFFPGHKNGSLIKYSSFLKN